MLINTVKEPLDIIVLAGQSNGEGYGLGHTDDPYVPTARILSMRDVDNQGYTVDDRSRGTFNITLPRTYLINITEERRTPTGRVGCLAHYFARRYERECLSPDRRLLIIEAAVGATGFAKKNWTPDGVLYQRLFRMCSLALGMNPENRIVAFLWHQGEQDAIFRTHLTPEVREETYFNDLSALVFGFRSRFGTVPFLAGGFADAWRPTCPGAVPVERALRSVISATVRSGFVDSTGLLVNDEVLENGDIFHFSRNSLHVFGERYFEKYREIISK